MGGKISIWHYIRNYKFNSIFIENFLLIALLIFLPLSGISVVIYKFFNNITIEETGVANRYALSKIRDITDMIAEESDRLSLRIATDTEVDALLNSTFAEYPDFTTIRRFININRLLRVSTITSDYIDSIYVYSERNNYIMANNKTGSPADQFFDRGWEEEYDQKKDKYNYWISFRTVKNEFNTAEEYHFITSFYKIPLYESKRLGFVAVNIDYDKLRGSINNDLNDTMFEDIIIVNENDQVLYNSDMSLIGKKIDDIDIFNGITFIGDKFPVIKTSNDANMSIDFLSSNYNRWKYISVTPLQYLEKKTRTLKEFMVASIILSVLILIVVAFIIALKVYEPIKNIISIIQNPREWIGLSDRRNKESLNELKFIINNIIKSFHEETRMENELEKRLELLKKAQSIALQSQINPHFLYNTLETINWMAINLTKGKNEVSSIVNSLSQLLRLSMSTQEHLVPIRMEIEHAQHYLEIQMVRYREKFEVCWEIDEAVLDCKIVKIVLQPLIENAIYHGIKPKSEKGVITVKGYIDGGNITIEVSDDGVGADAKIIEDLMLDMSNGIIKEDTHIGLSNVNQRIKLIFGNDYGITIKSELNSGTTVKITVPRFDA